MKMAHAPPGHHSVIGRPSVGGLTFAEYVVYRGEQVWVVVLKYILTLILYISFKTRSALTIFEGRKHAILHNSLHHSDIYKILSF